MKKAVPMKPVAMELAKLATLRADPSTPAAVAALRDALGSRHNLIVARAALIAQESNQAGLCPALAAALHRFYTPGSDKGCPAKTALTEALYTLAHSDAEAFLPGVRHVQMEASYGPAVDAAVDLRGFSALGLARAGYPDLILEMSELLADAEPAARQMAARALAYAGAESATPLLRFKVLSGDVEPNVTAECFAALMKLTPRRSLPFVARFVQQGNALLTEAALAIGESRSAEAFEFLRNAWEQTFDRASRQQLLPAVAMTRRPEAIAFLLERVADDRPGPAADAVAALSLFKHDAGIRERLDQAVDRNGDRAVRAAFARRFA